MKRTHFWCRHFGICEMISEKRTIFLLLWKCIFVGKKQTKNKYLLQISFEQMRSLTKSCLQLYEMLKHEKIFEFCQQKKIIHLISVLESSKVITTSHVLIYLGKL